jgi:hypothetical protein
LQRSDAAEDTGHGCGWASERDGDGRAEDAGAWGACVVVCLEMGLLGWVLVWLWG